MTFLGFGYAACFLICLFVVLDSYLIMVSFPLQHQGSNASVLSTCASRHFQCAHSSATRPHALEMSSVGYNLLLPVLGKGESYIVRDFVDNV